MRVVVIGCYSYRDCWTPFLSLFQKFFGGPIDLLTDKIDDRLFPPWVTVRLEQGEWCEMLAKYAEKVNEPILLFQDDFFLNEPARHHIIRQAKEFVEQGAACVRLYPCPGADQESLHPYFGGVSNQADYRISCQAAIWSPKFLAKIARHAKGSPAAFELLGSPYSRTLNDVIFAFKREVEPWPLNYLCSAIGRGEWSQDAKRLCDREGIQVDWSMRPMMAL